MNRDLGPDWRTEQARCLHKLGNLTLTGFNSELEARPFLEKKNHSVWGYAISPVWLSRSIASEDKWGAAQVEQRGAKLAERALGLWKPLVSDKAMLSQVDLEDAKERSADHSVANLKWTAGIEAWFDRIRAVAVGCSEDVVELPRAKSVVYRAPDWFLEIIPRAKGFTLRLAVDADELVGVADGVEDSSSWSFILNSAVDGGSIYIVNSETQLPNAEALVKRTFEIMFG